MWNDLGMHSGWWLGIGALHMLLFWVLIILVIVALVRLLSGKPLGSYSERSEKPPLQILQERYARGEINREEYQQRKADLERDQRP